MKRVLTPKKTSSPDYVFITFVFILAVFGLVMLTSASSDLGKLRFGDSYYYLTHQLIYGLAVGIVGFFLGSSIYYRKLDKWAIPILIVSILLLLLVFTPFGLKIKGSERWVQIGFITFQPGEILKLSFFIYLTSWLTKQKRRKDSFTEGFLPLAIVIGAITFLLIIQPSTSIAALIFSVAIITYFMAGGKIRFIASLIGLAILGGVLVTYITPYRLQRINTFLHPSQSDQLGSGYHIDQAKNAIGSGGLYGVGYGQSTTKLNFLPEPIGDSIFAIIAEELGFIGATAFILVFFIFIMRGLRIARKAPDSFGRLLTISFISIIGFQAFINIASISGVMPLTGMPLPFVSYGGTSLAIVLTMSGIIVNISKYRKK